MTDPRVEAYARLLVERSIGVEPGWQVMVVSSPLARPLVEEVVRLIARRGAYPLVRLGFVGEAHPWSAFFASEAPEELLGELATADRLVYEQLDAWIHIDAPENPHDLGDLSSERRALVAQATKPFTDRRLSFTMPWVGCRYPTPQAAAEAGMSTRAFEDFLYGACLLDWDALAEDMKRIVERFDRAEEVRIVGHETDLTLSLAGRAGMIDDVHLNMPGGEVFFSPVEDATEGVVTYSEFPAVQAPDVATGVRLRFEAGRIVEASAESGEAGLLAKLDRDPGARVLGELGIGCNPGIQRHLRNTLFDEKIKGTVHLAIGQGFPFLGGTNVSSVHWDMVKDLRQGGRLYADGELVQESGGWLLG